MRSMVGGPLKEPWVPHDTRDEVVDYVKHWSQRTELPRTRLVRWLGLGTSKFYQWQERYGLANEHNGQVPRDFWLEDWERRAILDFHDRQPLSRGGSITERQRGHFASAMDCADAVATRR